jgi:hypothetical protein
MKSHADDRAFAGRDVDLPSRLRLAKLAMFERCVAITELYITPCSRLSLGHGMGYRCSRSLSCNSVLTVTLIGVTKANV